MEFLDITNIRDTRFGKFAKIPKVGRPSGSPGSAWPQALCGESRNPCGGSKPDLYSKGKSSQVGQEGLLPELRKGCGCP